jgi:propanol-preferring alcohol dehydrogenase
VLPALTPDNTVVMIGIGGLGHMGVQILRAVSAARLVAADINEAKLELLANMEQSRPSTRVQRMPLRKFWQ